MRLSVPYLSGLLLLHFSSSSINNGLESFSPLFIGIIIVTGLKFQDNSHHGRFQSPIYRDYYCYMANSLTVLSGIFFQSPIYRDYYCYCVPEDKEFELLTFSPLFIGIIIVTHIFSSQRQNTQPLSVPYLSGLLLLRTLNWAESI